MKNPETAESQQNPGEAYLLITPDIDPFLMAKQAIDKLKAAGLPTIIPEIQAESALTSRSPADNLVRLDDFRKSEPQTPEKPAINILEPIELPRKDKKGENGWLDEEQHAANQKTARRLSQRHLEVLAELELASGEITAVKGPVDNEIKKRLGTNITSRIVQQSITFLRVKRLVELSNDGTSLTLTPQGLSRIALLKAYPGELRTESPKITPGTALQIIELVLRHNGLELEPDMSPADLPDRSGWLMPINSRRELAPIVASNIETTEDAVGRRLYDMVYKKKYVEGVIAYSDETAAKTYTNIRVLSEGLKYALIAQQELRDREGILDQEDVEELQGLIDGCQHLATNLARNMISDEFRQRYEHRVIYEMDAEVFLDERSYLEECFEQLRADFIASRKSSVQASQAGERYQERVSSSSSQPL